MAEKQQSKKSVGLRPELSKPEWNGVAVLAVKFPVAVERDFFPQIL